MLRGYLLATVVKGTLNGKKKKMLSCSAMRNHFQLTSKHQVSHPMTFLIIISNADCATGGVGLGVPTLKKRATEARKAT